MILFYAVLAVIFLLVLWFGYRNYLRLKHLNRSSVVNTLLAAFLVLTALSILQWFEIISQDLAAKFTMGLYSAAAGFFVGNGFKMIAQKNKAGKVEYVYRSFWVEMAPNLISIFLVAFGIYLTDLFTESPFTGIGITSGISLIGFGFFGWTIRLVPEFRYKGILILDHFIEWKKVMGYEWRTEGAVCINYYTEKNQIYEFTTSIPPEDQLLIERLLSRKIKEHEEERKDMLTAEKPEKI